MTQPSFTSTIVALTYTDPRFSWVGPTPDEADVAAALEVLQLTHAPTADDPDAEGYWGRCTGCREPWPCPRWVDGEHLAVQYLGRAADRVYAHARSIIATPDRKIA